MASSDDESKLSQVSTTITTSFSKAARSVASLKPVQNICIAATQKGVVPPKFLRTNVKAIDAVEEALDAVEIAEAVEAVEAAEAVEAMEAAEA